MQVIMFCLSFARFTVNFLFVENQSDKYVNNILKYIIKSIVTIYSLMTHLTSYVII